MEKAVNSDLQKLTKELARAQAYAKSIIEKQETIRGAALERIAKINKDIPALQHRLKPYIGKKAKAYDEMYYDLKDQYEELLMCRATLQRTVAMCEESITSTELNLIDGASDEEFDSV